MNDVQEQLLACLKTLSEQEQRSLLDFARYLSERHGDLPMPAPTFQDPVAPTRKAEPPPEPRDIERPESEKVVAAIKRLSQTYYMLDKTRMLGHTSGLMTQHIMTGREAREVIDELEAIFQREYDELRARHEE
jgi:hypothetical protein